MLAAQVSGFGRPETAIEIVELADPGEPDADEVTIDAEFAPINPADVLNLEGKYGALPPKLPMIPGAEVIVADQGAPITMGGADRRSSFTPSPSNVLAVAISVPHVTGAVSDVGGPKKPPPGESMRRTRSVWVSRSDGKEPPL